MPLENQAKLITGMFRATRKHMEWNNPIWTDDQNIEILTRTYVREDIEELLGEQLPSVALQELKDVVFTLAYPAYAKKAKI
jgi:hypothetical protein